MNLNKEQFSKLIKVRFSTEELVEIAVDFLYSQAYGVSSSYSSERDSVQDEDIALQQEKPIKQKKKTAQKAEQQSGMKFITDKNISGLNKAEMEEFNKAEEDDKKNKDTFVKPTSRPSPLVNVSCRACGKREKVSPALFTKPDRYKCNMCSAAACDSDDSSNEENEE
jgi:hypothetical protein